MTQQLLLQLQPAETPLLLLLQLQVGLNLDPSFCSCIRMPCFAVKRDVEFAIVD